MFWRQSIDNCNPDTGSGVASAYAAPPSWFKLDNKKFECVEVNWKSKMLPIEQRVPQGLWLSHFLQRY